MTCKWLYIICRFKCGSACEKEGGTDWRSKGMQNEQWMNSASQSFYLPTLDSIINVKRNT